MLKELIIIIFVLLCQVLAYGGGKTHSPEPGKTLKAVFTDNAPDIDGELDDIAWKRSSVPATHFVQYEPFNGAKPDHETEVLASYDNRSIYFAIKMYDSAPDSILTELGKRDQRNLNADYIAVDISPYNDGLNSFEFRVTASGVQTDIKHSGGSSDVNWDAVWKSAVEITSYGWVAEIEIPYAALRFPKKTEQEWTINFWRSVRRNRQTSTWNFVDKGIDGIRNQYGRLKGIENIKPPLRLSFEPYLSGYMERSPGEPWKFAYSYGTDLKLGLSESFTLDMTLIPDFGQVESDDVIIDLSPFEIYYSERRQFFTEGTELFSRGDIFYSRRVGSEPAGYRQVEDMYEDDQILSNPPETQLLNATKISGRNRNGLGIGVFNAITANMEATVKDSSGAEKDVVTQPFTNYNMVVFDQSLKNNSYFSLYNTNVYMGDFYYTANVSGTEFRLAENSNTYAVSAQFNVSQKYFPDTVPEFGHSIYAEAEKISGNFLFGVVHNTQTDTYDPNDLGFNRKPNDMRNGIFLEYDIFDPFWRILEMSNEVNFNYYNLYAPRKYVNFSAEYEIRVKFRNQLSVGFDAEYHPFEQHDYWEPRHPWRMVRYPSDISMGFFFSPDYTKNFVVDLRAGYFRASAYNMESYNLRVAPRIRFSDKLFMVYAFNYSPDLNSIGYVTDSTGITNEPVIIFGKRNVNNITNTIDLSYTFNNKASLSMMVRHYWFKVEYDQYYDLMDDGYLKKTDFTGDFGFNYNAFNVDMFFTWEFAPGSEMVIAWKNSISTYDDPVVDNFFDNLGNTLSSPATNSFSVRVLYFLDYQYFKRKNRRPS
jgi:hypothetical protein